jgi:hypothetical protein
VTGTSKVSGVLTLGSTLSNGTYTYTLPAATGTLALTSDIPVVTGFVPYTGATADVNLGIYTLTASGVDSVGYTARGSGTLSGYLILKQGTTYLGNVVGYNSINANARKYVFISDVDGTNYKSAIFELSSLTNNTDRTYTLPDATGTLALTSDLAAYVPITRTLTGLGSISVSGSGDLSANRTISIAQSSVSSDGYLSATDFNTFNNKQATLSLTTTGTSGAATLVGATLNIPQYTDAYTGTVTSVAALTIGTTGTDLSSSVANSTTTPVITLNVPTASAANRGALSSADWTTFNNKYNLPSLTSGSVLFSNGSTIAQDNANFFWDDTNNRLGIGTASPAVKLHIIGGGEPLRIESTNATGGNYVQYKNASGDLGYIGWGSSANNNLNIVNQQNAGITFLLNSTEKMILDASGNLGLGVTPSDWAFFKAVQVNGGNSFVGYNNQAEIWSNSFYDGASKYYANGFATRYAAIDGRFEWYQAPSGTAGNAITFTQAMTLFSTGNLAIATTTDSGYKLDVNGTGRFSGNVGVGANATSIVGYAGKILTIGNGTQAENAIEIYSSSTVDNVLGDIAWLNASSSDADKRLSIIRTNRIGANNSGSMSFFTKNAGTFVNALTLASTGAATFSSTVTATGQIIANAGSGAISVSGTGYTINPTNMLIGRYTSTRGYIQVPTNGTFEIWNGGTFEIATFNETGKTTTLYGALTGTSATFSSSVTALSGLFSNSGNSLAVTTSANSTTFMSVGINSGTNKSIFGFDVTDGGFVGTITNDDFTIRSNNTKRVTISATTGAATFSSSVEAGKSGSLTVGDLLVDNPNKTVYVGRQSSTSGDNTKFIVRNRLNSNYFYVSPTDDLAYFNNCNVGIGTSSPASKLHILGTTRFDNPNGNTLLEFYNTSTYQGNIITVDTGSILRLTAGTGMKLRLTANDSNTAGMDITTGGNVLIGTTTDDTINKLQVSGGIYSSNYNTNFNSVTINSSTNVNTAVLDIGIVCFRDAVNGGGCLVFYENGQTPVIVSQSGGTTFTTSSPSATEIQISNRSGSRGLQALGGSSRNSVQLIWSVFRITGLSA